LRDVGLPANYKNGDDHKWHLIPERLHEILSTDETIKQDNKVVAFEDWVRVTYRSNPEMVEQRKRDYERLKAEQAAAVEATSVIQLVTNNLKEGEASDDDELDEEDKDVPEELKPDESKEAERDTAVATDRQEEKNIRYDVKKVGESEEKEVGKVEGNESKGKDVINDASGNETNEYERKKISDDALDKRKSESTILGIGNEHIDENTSESKPNIHEIGKEHQDSNENNGQAYEGKSLSGGEPMELSDTELSKDIDKLEMKIINDDHEEENEKPIELSDSEQSKDLYTVPENVIDSVTEAIAQ
jgi:hypothetical protein